MDINQLTMDLLNNSGVRDVLRIRVPEIEKLENLDGLRNLRLTSLKTESIILLSYEATATSDFYPYVRSKLINAGVIKHSKVDFKKRINKGQPDEYESLHLCFYGANVQAFLKVYNPNYLSD